MGAARQKTAIVVPTSDHQRRCDRHGRHIVLGDARVVAGMGGRQLADGEHRSHGIDSRDADGLVGILEALAVLEPGDEEGRVALDHEAGLADAHADHQVLPEGDGLDPGGNWTPKGDKKCAKRKSGAVQQVRIFIQKQCRL